MFLVFRERQSSSTVEELSSQVRDVGKMILNIPTLNATGGKEGKRSMSQVDHCGCGRRSATGTGNNGPFVQLTKSSCNLLHIMYVSL